MPGLVESLRAEIRHKEGEVEQLRERLRRAEHEAEPALEPVPAPAPAPASTPAASDPDAGTSSPANPAGIHWQWQLPERDYNRYARQLVLPDVGLAGE